MPLIIIRQDITKMKVDAIVNAANSTLLGGGGVDGAIHKAAGPQLLEECKKLNGCETGDAKITNAYNLPCKKIIHTVGPRWMFGKQNEEELLKKCYENSLKLALENNIESIAFPLISSGIYRFPKDKAVFIAKNTIENFLQDHEMIVYIVVFDNSSFTLSKSLVDDITEFIDELYVGERENFYTRLCLIDDDECFEEGVMLSKIREKNMSIHSIENMLTNIDDTFSERLLKLIDLKEKTDVEVYKKANIDRKLFSKIRSNKDYKPKKNTAIAFCFSLKLSIEESCDLLETAGYTLSHSSKFDIIIKYFLINKIYNINEVNEILFVFNQNLLGG